MKRTNHNLNPHALYGIDTGFEPRPQWWEISALTTAAPLLSCTAVHMYYDKFSRSMLLVVAVHMYMLLLLCQYT